jgi:hypothetical protein
MTAFHSSEEASAIICVSFSSSLRIVSNCCEFGTFPAEVPIVASVLCIHRWGFHCCGTWMPDLQLLARIWNSSGLFQHCSSSRFSCTVFRWPQCTLRRTGPGLITCNFKRSNSLLHVVFTIQLCERLRSQYQTVVSVLYVRHAFSSVVRQPSKQGITLPAQLPIENNVVVINIYSNKGCLIIGSISSDSASHERIRPTF